VSQPAAWPWPDSLDALIAAPAFHQVLFEDERVRVVRTHIPPGQTVPLHTHRWPGVLHILGWSDFIRRDEGGNILLDTRQAAPPEIHSASWLEPLPPHTVENIGASEISTICMELKGA